ncbi:hypothetical protein M3B11_13095, partial [Brevibacterium sp. p3-SID960]|uniref:hypothetical protein n=1 Tax=Brevibacterium sp. p3-SID960 TaxID=2916063 RepID=UPI0021A8F501
MSLGDRLADDADALEFGCKVPGDDARGADAGDDDAPGRADGLCGRSQGWDVEGGCRICQRLLLFGQQFGDDVGWRVVEFDVSWQLSSTRRWRRPRGGARGGSAEGLLLDLP